MRKGLPGRRQRTVADTTGKRLPGKKTATQSPPGQSDFPAFRAPTNPLKTGDVSPVYAEMQHWRSKTMPPSAP